MTDLLHITDLTVSYSKSASPILQNLSLQMQQNEIICLLGSSGAGKTTLLRSIAGVQPIEHGVIELDGKCLNDHNTNIPPERREIGMIFQDYALFPHLTVAENILFAQHDHTDNPLQDLLELINLAGREADYPHSLSGGQQQRVAIARALAVKPKLLLFDEPFSNIDAHLRQSLIADIRQILKSRKIPAIFVTHNQEEAFQLADRVAYMHNGQILQIDLPSELYESPVSPVIAENLSNGIWLPASLDQSKTLNTPIGELLLEDSLKTTNKQFRFFLRPHQLVIENTSSTATNTFSAKVISARYLGDSYVYRVRIAGYEIDVRQGVHSALQVEQTVTLRILPHKPILFSEDHF